MNEQGLPFFRCTLCMGVVSMWDIYKDSHKCPKCGGARVVPTNLSLYEKFLQICKHPRVWTWNEQNFY